MNIARPVLLATLVGTVVMVSACTREAVDDTTTTVEESVDTTLDAISNGATKVVDGTEEIAGAIADTSRDLASAAGEAITDAWITTTLNATFVDEALLEDSDINVDTTDHVVTLKGTVTSAAAKARAAAIAHDARSVTRVINQLVVK